MSFMQEISEEELNRDHRSQRIGGTDMYTLMGQGYLEKGQTYLDAIMEVWERKRGLGTKYKPTNEAMRTGIEQEPAAFQRLVDALSQGKLGAQDDRYDSARTYGPFRGLRLQRGSGDGYGIGGNMDAPLFDVSGEYEDPISGETINGEDYVRRYAEEQHKIQLQKEVNRARELDGEDPWPISEPKYQAPPYAGVTDIKVTQDKSVFYDEIYNGLQPRFVVQTHHYLEVLREESRRQGFSAEHDPELLGIYRFCLENNKERFHEIDYDPELVAEMRRRVEIFTEKCLKQGIPPNSSELRDEFYVYPVKGTQPEAVLPDPETEDLFKGLLEKQEMIKERQNTIKGYETHLKADLALGVKQVNGVDPEADDKGPMAGVFVDGRIVSFEKKITNKKVTNEAALNGALMGAGEAREAMSAIQAVLGDDSLSQEEQLAAIAKAAQGVSVERLPQQGSSLEDYQSVQRVEASQPTISIRDNKSTRAHYQKLVEQRDGEDPEVDEDTTREVRQDAMQLAHVSPEQPDGHEAGEPETPAAEATADTGPPTPAQYQPATQEPLTPADAITGPVSTDEPLQDTPVNDRLEVEAESQPELAEGATNTSEMRGQMEADADPSVDGLASKPEEVTQGPDLLGGEIPGDLVDQTLPEDLFEPAGAESQPHPEELSLGIPDSPFR